MLPQAIKILSKSLSKTPNIGPKNAEKLAIWFALKGQKQALELGHQLINLSQNTGICPNCMYFSSGSDKLCDFCSDTTRDQHILCLVEQVMDVLDIEETHTYKGLYFVLGGVISPLEGQTISSLPFDKLKKIVNEKNIKEMIIALGATAESDVTIMYLKEFLTDTDVKLTVLARGISVGTKIQFAGKKSIIEAFRTREILD